MADGKDTAVEAMKTPATHRPSHCTSRVGKRTYQLSNRDNSMLPSRQVSKGSVLRIRTRLTFGLHIGPSPNHARFSPLAVDF